MNTLLPPGHLDTADILRASRSSFVPAFRLLPRGRRNDLETFYAFCRVADDLADADGHAQADRHAALEAWRAGFRAEDGRGLPDNLRGLIKRRGLDRELFLELLDGVGTDLSATVRMATRTDLDLYCHRVAGTVGQLCLPIFGADRDRCAGYAEILGRALQYTNILRDTASDLQRGRLYYPLDELTAAGVDAARFPRGAQNYLQSFAGETAKLFDQAAIHGPAEERSALRPARIMASIYRSLLGKMVRDGLRVTEKRYRLTAPEKILALARALAPRPV